MASTADLEALEADLPWLRPDFQADLAALSGSTAEAARRFAADVRLLARLAAQVPRCPFDERGATPWTSFRREIAVARSISDVAAAMEIRTAVQLVRCLPRMLALLEQGAVTVRRAQVFVTEVQPYDDELAARLDERLAARAAALPAWRIAQEVRRAAAELDAEAAALRTAEKNAGRSVTLQPLSDDQALLLVQGPAVAVTRCYDTLDQRARALKRDGDPRTLAQLRFDLMTVAFPCATHVPPHADAQPPGPPVLARDHAQPADDPAVSPAESQPADALRPLAPSRLVEPAPSDCRRSRPVQASITIPVETALGLSNDPAWLDGYGWVSAPTCRQLLVDAELRKVCVSGVGELVDVDERDRRPPPTPGGVREVLLEMVVEDAVLHGAAWRTEEQHDPSPALREHVALRDRFCDGPTGLRIAARRADLDHETPYPLGPTAAWNLVARARRTHQLKHAGWTPLRTPTATIWFSPAGQVVEVPRHQAPPPDVEDDAVLPDADALAALERAQLRPREPEDERPWLPAEPPPF